MTTLLRRALRGAAWAVALLAGVVLVQVVRLRGVRLLPGYPGFWISHTVLPSRGAPSGDALRFVVFGDSTTVGVGVDRPEDSLPHRLAWHIADASGLPVRVISFGWAGARMHAVPTDQIPRAMRPRDAGAASWLATADIVAIVVGANDATHRTRPAAFRRDLRASLAAIRDAVPAADVVVAGIPRLRGVLRHLEPLITLADIGAAPLRRVQRREAARAGVTFADLARDLLPRLIGRVDRRTALASDRFHPGPAVYAAWAEVIADALRAADVATMRPRAAAPGASALLVPDPPSDGSDD